MPITINRTTDKELRTRKQELIHELEKTYEHEGPHPMNYRDLRDLASLGCLSRVERKLYDELRRVQILLGE